MPFLTIICKTCVEEPDVVAMRSEIVDAQESSSRLLPWYWLALDRRAAVHRPFVIAVDVMTSNTTPEGLWDQSIPMDTSRIS